MHQDRSHYGSVKSKKINEARSNYFSLFYRQSSDGISHILMAFLILLIIYCALIALFTRPN
ncbi:hypothetical protein C1E47_15450 [Vibrio cholerae]|nr:hypothetical protein [Vibrio cholerae]